MEQLAFGNLLKKFDSITDTVSSRISLEDENFCKVHQEAYEKALNSFKEIDDFITKKTGEVSNIFIKNDVSATDYFPKNDFKWTTCSVIDICKQFISILANYFSKKYNVSISTLDIQDHLIPKKREIQKHGFSRFGFCKIKDEEVDKYIQEEEKAEAEYEQKIFTLRLTYNDVVNCIFEQMGGLSFEEKRLQEIKDKAYESSHCLWNNTKSYEAKKNTLVFTNGCSFDRFYLDYYNENKITCNVKGVISAIVEFDRVDYKMHPLSNLLEYRFDTPEIIEETDKIKKVKCFKNGRLDITFKSEVLVQEFVNTYLEK